MKTDKELSIEEQVIQDCPILFRNIGRPLTESIISFGFECGKGWHTAIANTCRELEMVNSEYYKKYRVRIQADQIKEKFGEIRFYYSVVVDPCAFIVWFANRFNSVYQYLNAYKRFDYKMTKVVDVEPYDYDETKVLTKEQYECQKAYKYTASNVELKEENGKYLEICHLHNYGKSHMEPTRLKLLWHVKEFANKMFCRLMYSFKRSDTAIVRNCIASMHSVTSKLIKQLELECAQRCEDCGSQIGTEWSPACRTTGWIAYLCQSCAEKHNSNYVKNGELWCGKKRIKTKKQMQAKYDDTIE